jgi:hypothetical protein
VILPALLFWVRIALATLCLLYFHMNSGRSFLFLCRMSLEFDGIGNTVVCQFI